MKQFNLFPVARRLVAIIQRQYIFIHIGKGHTHIHKKNPKNNTYNGQGELFLNSRQTVACKLTHNTFRLQKNNFINVVKK